MAETPAPRETVEPETYLSTAEAAAILRRAPQTLRAWRIRGTTGLRFIKLGGRGSRCVYAASELRRFLEQNTFSSTSEMTASQAGR